MGISQTLRNEQRAPPIFGRATITFGIGPHSSYYYNNTRFIIITVIYYYPLNVNAQLFLWYLTIAVADRDDSFTGSCFQQLCDKIVTEFSNDVAAVTSELFTLC